MADTHYFVPGSVELKTGYWVACEEPERPLDPNKTAFHSHCRKCLLALIAHELNGGEPIVIGGRSIREFIESCLDLPSFPSPSLGSHDG